MTPAGLEPDDALSFQVLQTSPDGLARRGCLKTAHGCVDTPAFMPVGTRASVKGVWPRQVCESGAQILLGNTYHLNLRPGPELIAEFGGLHRFMSWDGPILTDSGGYQVFSLAELRRITDEGVTFRSHIDGQLVTLDPVRATRIQHLLGADIIMAFDECPPGDADRGVVQQAVERTLRWAAQCKTEHGRLLVDRMETGSTPQDRLEADPARLGAGVGAPDRLGGGSRLSGGNPSLFGIVQGGVYPDLRRECAERLIEMDFPGYAVGGLSVGETHEQMVDVLGPTVRLLPSDRPRYLMGVGTPRDILAAVRAGVDMFDCVLPTRNGRRAYAFTAGGWLRLRNERYRRQQGPLEEGCPCPTCRDFSRGYIRHLFMVGEMLGPMLVTVHNLWFYQRFMSRLRDLIPTGDWATMLAEFPIVGMPGGAATPTGETD
jgi:queuine tRNA-ribosyltransferase